MIISGLFVIDGSNVVMSHGNKEVFSCLGIQLAVDWFVEKGHKDITPACDSDGITVSNDNYRDSQNEKPEWKKLTEERPLMYSFVNDTFVPRDDPLGRHGPSLENFLRKRPVVPEHKKQPCPYGKKCTYGHKCKYYHPERANQPQRSVADELRAFAKLSAVKRMSEGALAKCGTGPTTAKGDSGSEAKLWPCEPEERLSAVRKPEANSVPSLVSALSVPTMQPAKSHAAGALNTRSARPAPSSSPTAPLEHMSSVQHPHPPILVNQQPRRFPEQFPKYDSVRTDHGYCSMLSDFSNMNMSGMHNVDSFCSMEHEHGVYRRNPSQHCPEPCLSHSNSDSFSSYGELYMSSVDSSLDESMKGRQQQSPAQNRLQAFSHGGGGGGSTTKH
ncbi:unnamed protein product [Coregonus sp. 'balchen']|nr:unnamed protein product [Coregonus sp. 'balchen']